MPLLAKNESKGFEKPTPGMHDAICVFVEDIGTHTVKTQWGDKKQHKIVICWEIDELIKSGEYTNRPFMLSRRYTFTLFEKGNLSKTLESWFAKKISDEVRKTGFDLEKLIGKRCTLNLIESDDGQYVNVENVLPPNVANKLTPVCTVVPEWITRTRAESLEAKESAVASSNDFNDTFAEPADQPLPF